ncbi:HD domain-containing protein [Thermanaerothrix sp.]|jgi:(p)ppGpp synthase/HD superfamily hydrolase|uniref:HD domain-containing protein n=1 Tax=Thermanaerothrix sp. TaxID=2972675 RepID=UPI002ADE3FEF|nr:HD domain-containing protein [Thermanaerothrix sp.]
MSAKVTVTPVKDIRPRLEDEFAPGEFIPRTPAIAEAYAWGQELHKGQYRLSGEPYFETHCVWVAGFLDKLIGREAWTIAALLHDAVEDQGETLDAIRARFPGPLGEEVAYIVDGVTKISNPRDGRTREIETLRKLAQFRDPGVYLVKLADKSHNLLTLHHMPEHKRQQKALEVIRAYGKLAGILNCYRWRRWLEDLAFPYADPETYAFVKEKIDADPRLDLSFINPMMEQLGNLMEESGISGSVELTVNGYWQTWQKLRRMARARRASMDSFMAVNDLVSFRLVVESQDEYQCYQLLPKVNRFLGPYLDQNRFDDYIACPQNGYRALQITAWLPDLGAIEVAIATREMEEENHWGVVYALKQGKDISHYRPIEIFTPSGSARFLPEGSTVLDAIASIQQEFLLDKISAVKVNGNLARLSDHIQPGDIVEVITGNNRLSPSEEWLAFSNPSTARLLRGVLVTEALKRSAEKGRQIAKQLLKERGLLALEDVQALEPTRVDNLLEQLACASLEDFYAALGSGAIRQQEVSQTLDRVGITNDALHWTTIQLLGSARANRPGTLARLASLVSQAGGNILRSVNNTLPDGRFSLRLVVSNLSPEQCEPLYQAYLQCGVELEVIEIT